MGKIPIEEIQLGIKECQRDILSKGESLVKDQRFNQYGKWGWKEVSRRLQVETTQ